MFKFGLEIWLDWRVFDIFNNDLILIGFVSLIIIDLDMIFFLIVIKLLIKVFSILIGFCKGSERKKYYLVSIV